jgi:integrase/recombinase XerD
MTRNACSKPSWDDRQLRCDAATGTAGFRTTPKPSSRAGQPALPDAGVPLRDVPEAASHADLRTTMRYDRARVSLDRHATYIVAAYLAGAAR